MKKVLNCCLVMATVFTAVLFTACSAGKTSEAKKIEKAQKEQQIRELVESGHFFFKADRVMPNRVLRGYATLPGENYGVVVKKDSLDSYLPFFGYMYGPYTQGSGITFDTEKYTYDVAKEGKRGWIVNVDTQDAKNRVKFRFSFSVSRSGMTTLTVIQPTRETQSYSGYITPL